eukprot:g38044.t1
MGVLFLMGCWVGVSLLRKFSAVVCFSKPNDFHLSLRQAIFGTLCSLGTGQNFSRSEKMPEQSVSLATMEMLSCLSTLLEQQKFMRSYASPAAHIQHRSVLIDYIFEITDEFALSATTAHIAVKYMDIILSSQDADADNGKRIPTDRWQLVVMVSLWISAKLHEVNPPTLLDLYEAAGQFYHPLLIKAFEIEVLQKLDWRLHVVVPLQFLDLWGENGLVFPGDRSENKPVTAAKTTNLSKCLRYFACVGVQDYESEAFLPSHVAAGMVAASRSALRIEPAWNGQLTIVTGLGPVEVYKHYTRLWAVHQARTSDATPAIALDAFFSQQSTNPRGDSRFICSIAKELRSKLRMSTINEKCDAQKQPATPQQQLVTLVQ